MFGGLTHHYKLTLSVLMTAVNSAENDYSKMCAVEAPFKNIHCTVDFHTNFKVFVGKISVICRYNFAGIPENLHHSVDDFYLKFDLPFRVNFLLKLALFTLY